MKAKNPTTGNFQEVFVKALDGLPIGTTVEYTGSSSNIPTGWEVVSGQNKIIKTSEARALAGSVVNVTNNSTTDAYSCDYTNKLKNDMLAHPDYNIGINRIFRFLRSESYLSMQGVCITQNKTLLCALWEGSGSNNSKIIEINYETGSILKSRDVSFGWCNGITLNTSNNRIYLVPRGNTGGNLKTIKVLKYSDLSDVETITFSDYLQSAYYDKINNAIYLMNEWNKKETSGCKIYKVNSSFAIQETIELQYSEINKLHVQNFAINGDYIYVLSSEPRCLCVFKKDGTLFKEYALPEIINELYYSGEYQDIDFLNNQCYIASGDVVTDIESINQLFTIDFNKEDNNTDESLIPIHYGYNTTLYVDASSTAINPDGTSSNKFKSINEALRFQKNCTIQVASGIYGAVDLRNSTCKSIIGDSTNYPDIRGLKISYCNNCYLENINIDDSYFDTKGYVHIVQSDVTLKNMNIAVVSPILTETKYGIYVGKGSKCKLSTGITIQMIDPTAVDPGYVAPYNQIYVDSASVLYTPSTYYTIEKHNESATIVGGVKMFDSEITRVVNDVILEDSLKYIFDAGKSLADYFKFIEIVYQFHGNYYLKRFPLRTSNNPMLIEEETFTDDGIHKKSRVLITIGDKKLTLSDPKLITTTAAGASTVTENSSTSSSDYSIILKNAILY